MFKIGICASALPLNSALIGLKHDEADGAGLGYVDVYSPGASDDRLESVASNLDGGSTRPGESRRLRPISAILMGQFGSGNIDVFDPVTGQFKGFLNDATNPPIAIDGLRDIMFGSGGSSGSSGPSTTLFFTAGADGEQNGLFGAITAIENVLGGDQ